MEDMEEYENKSHSTDSIFCPYCHKARLPLEVCSLCNKIKKDNLRCPYCRRNVSNWVAQISNEPEDFLFCHCQYTKSLPKYFSYNKQYPIPGKFTFKTDDTKKTNNIDTSDNYEKTKQNSIVFISKIFILCSLCVIVILAITSSFNSEFSLPPNNSDPHSSPVSTPSPSTNNYSINDIMSSNMVSYAERSLATLQRTKIESLTYTIQAPTNSNNSSEPVSIYITYSGVEKDIEALNGNIPPSENWTLTTQEIDNIWQYISNSMYTTTSQGQFLPLFNFNFTFYIISQEQKSIIYYKVKNGTVEYESYKYSSAYTENPISTENFSPISSFSTFTDII